MKILMKGVAGFFVVCCSWSIYAQADIVNYNLKKGEVFDVLVQIMNPDNEESIKRYLKEALPIAREYTYKNLPGFKVREHTAGNLKADQIILGKWNTLDERIAFVDNITKQLPDFHQQRRSIWAFFGLAFYTLKSDLSFQIDKSKYNVVTTYWAENKRRFTKKIENWKNKVVENGGVVCVVLKNAESTQGYLYEPDYLLITSWENEEAFERFTVGNDVQLQDSYKHLNQFVLY